MNLDKMMILISLAGYLNGNLFNVYNPISKLNCFLSLMSTTEINFLKNGLKVSTWLLLYLLKNAFLLHFMPCGYIDVRRVTMHFISLMFLQLLFLPKL